MSKRLTGLNPLVKWEIKGSIPFYSTMIIINKITGRDVSHEFLGLMEKLITNEEFEIITLTPPNK